MYTSIIDYVNSIDKPIKNEDVKSSLTDILSGISEHTIPTLESIIEKVDFKTIGNNEYLTILQKMSSFSGKSPKDIFSGILYMFKDILKEDRNLTKLVTAELSPVIVRRTITAREAIILRTVDDVFAMSVFTIKLCDITLTDVKTTYYSKHKLKQTKDLIAPFGSLYKFYSKGFGKYIKSLPKVSDAVVVTDKPSSLMDVLFDSTGKSVSVPGVSGFRGNPIFHYRMWRVDRDVAKLELLRKTRHITELKLLDLKMRLDNENDPTLTKQIEYYEDKLSGALYKIETLEEI